MWKVKKKLVKVNTWVDTLNKLYFYYSVGEHFNPNNSPHGSPENDLSKRVNLNKFLTLAVYAYVNVFVVPI